MNHYQTNKLISTCHNFMKHGSEPSLCIVLPTSLMILWMFHLIWLSHLQTHRWLEVELVVLAVELPVDPAAVIAVPAQEAIDLPPAVVIVPPIAAAVAVRTGKTKFNSHF